MELVFDPVIQTYGTQNLGARPIFEGGFINFGYWKKISTPNGFITKKQRIQASIDLYYLITDALEIRHNDTVLEAGCGRGHGCIQTFSKTKPKEMIGIDITPEQIMRAQWLHKNILKRHKNIDFQISMADQTPFENEYFNVIYSVEAMQCFPSIERFAKEAWRLLSNNGRMTIAAHFSTSQAGYQEARKLIPTIDQEIDRLIPIQEVRDAFSTAGFTEIGFESIGAHVFEPFDTWITQVQCPVWWTHNTLDAYKKGFIDYYVLKLKKS